LRFLVLGFLLVPHLPVTGANQAQDDKKQSAARVDPARVEEAIKKGILFLRSLNPQPTEPWKHTDGHFIQKTELVLWTYLRAGVKPVEPEFQVLFKDMMERRLEATYAVAIQALILEDLDRVKYQWRIQKCAQFLIDNQAKGGGWGYGEPSNAADSLPTGDAKLDPAAPVRPKPKVMKRLTVKKTKEGERPDNSCSAYVAMALRACSDTGIVIPPETIAQAETWWRKTHKGPGEGWCYADHSDHKAYGSMTAEGLASLAILGHLRGAKKTWKSDPQELAALQWLSKNLSLTTHPGPFEQVRASDPTNQFYYWMESLERAMMLTGTETLAKRDWYDEGTQAIMKLQEPTGTWNRTVQDTCFAILFLLRASAALEPEAKK
jgi:hypothetical protein